MVDEAVIKEKAIMRYEVNLKDYSVSPESKFGIVGSNFRNEHPGASIETKLVGDIFDVYHAVEVSIRERTSERLKIALIDYFDQVGNPKYVVKGSDFSVVEELLGQDDILIKPFLSLGNRKVVSKKSNFLARLV